jgi:hypothetical protein
MGEVKEKGINILCIFNDAKNLYLKHFKFLICISLVTLLTSITQHTYAFVFKQNFSYLVDFILGILDTLLLMWIYTALTYKILFILNREELTFLGTLKSPKRKYWRVIRVSIVFGFITAIPFVLVFILMHILTKSFVINPIINILLWMVGIVPVLYILTKYYFVMTSATLESDEINSFSKSKELTKGNYLKIFVGIFIISVLLYALPIINGFYLKKIEKKFADSIVYLKNIIIAFYNVIVLPLNVSFVTIFYLRLKAFKIKTNQNLSNNNDLGMSDN